MGFQIRQCSHVINGVRCTNRATGWEIVRIIDTNETKVMDVCDEHKEKETPQTINIALMQATTKPKASMSDSKFTDWFDAHDDELLFMECEDIARVAFMAGIEAAGK